MIRAHLVALTLAAVSVGGTAASCQPLNSPTPVSPASSGHGAVDGSFEDDATGVHGDCYDDGTLHAVHPDTAANRAYGVSQCRWLTNSVGTVQSKVNQYEQETGQ